MEVHAHTHTPRKKWAHYFWEFLMLFLAVTLGFLVENQREHYVENLRARDYAQSLYDDFKIDSSRIENTTNEKIWREEKLDSLRTLIYSGEYINRNEQFCYYERFMYTGDVFTSQDVTYQQLRNSGSFRYIKNIKLYKKVADYYNLYSRYLLVDKTWSFELDLSKLESKIFAGKDLTVYSNYDAFSVFEMINRPQTNSSVFKVDKESVYHLQNIAEKEIWRSNISRKFLSSLKENAKEIMSELKKEYHLK